MRRRCNQLRIPVLFLTVFSVAAALQAQTSAQELPDEINGYKVHRVSINVMSKAGNEPEDKSPAVQLDFDGPQLSAVSPFGLTLDFHGRLRVMEQSGTVDVLSFKGVTINGITVQIEDYRHQFRFKKNRPVVLKEPIKVFVSTGEGLKGAVRELINSKDRWQIKGTVYVFGRFKKSLFKFKRVIPVGIDMFIENPVSANKVLLRFQ